MHLNFTEPLRSGKGPSAFFLNSTLKFLMRVGFINIFIILCSIQLLLANSGNGQSLDSINVTIELRNENLKSLFQKIEKQTGLLFAYPPREASNLTLTLPRETRSVKATLDMAFSGTSLTYKQVNNSVIVFNEDQTEVSINEKYLVITVSGTVTDSLGTPLPGVNVIIKGTTNGTTTDSQGSYSLEANDSDILVFSFIGYKSYEVSVNNQTVINLMMEEDVKTLGEVTIVSTGYQELPKERATGSFQFVNREELNRRVGPDILTRLEGLTTGILFDRRSLDPSSNSIAPNKILIRGLSTLNANMQSPLIVINNFPYEGDINNINPNDVETITILMDAAAASIWGARAANGVIVITTRQGKYEQPLKISFNTNINLIAKPDLFKNPIMSTGDFIETEKYLFDQGFYDGDLSDVFSFPALSPVVEVLEKQRSGVLTDSETSSQLEELKKRDVRNDFDRYIYQAPVNQQYYLNLSGGDKSIRYSLSTGYDKGVGALVGDSYKRINLRSDNSFKPLKNLDVNVSVAYANSKNENNSIGHINSSEFYISPGKNLYPYAQFADNDGNALSIVKDYRSGYVDTAGMGKLLDWKYKPLKELANKDNSTLTQDIILGTSASYKILKSLSLQLSYQYQHTNGTESRYSSEDAYYTRNQINLFTEIQGGSVVNNLPRGGLLDQSNFGIRSQAGRAQLNFNTNWNEKHELNAMIGAEIRENIASGDFDRTYGYNSSNLSTAAVDYLNFYPLYGGRGDSQIGYLRSFYKRADNFVSGFLNAAYTFDTRYTVSLSARRDAANLFGVDTNDKWKPLWTIGAAWNISNESFAKFEFVNLLRLRSSYGYMGNVNNSISPYTIIRLESASGSPYNLPFANISEPANPDLSWETINQFNIGLDFGLLDNRLSGSVEAYKKISDNLILSSEVDPTSGIFSVQRNSAGLKGNGFELSLNSKNIDGKIKWSTNFGLSHITNEVTHTDISSEGNTVGPVISSSGRSITSLEGISPYPVFSYPFAGLDPTNGNPQGYLGETVSTDYRAISRQLFDTTSINYHGSAIPTTFGFLTNTIQYRRFSLTVNINYRLGYYFRKSTIRYYELYNQYITHPDFSQRWQNPGDENSTTIPSMIYPISNTRRDDFYSYSSPNVLRGDNIRIGSIRLSYEFGGPLIRKLRLQQLQLYVIATNLGIIWRANKYGLDPDYDVSNPYPVPKQVAFGLKLEF